MLLYSQKLVESNQYSSARIQNNVDYKNIQKDYRLAKQQVEQLQTQVADMNTAI